MDKLLLLGADSSAITAINHCRNNNVYTIVTDYTKYEDSVAKHLSDEYWMIDIKDTEALKQKCLETGITGVYAGNNETCLDYAKMLTKELGLPFYASDIAWEATRNKIAFKEHCKAVGLDVAKRFDLTKPFTREQLNAITYPVIVKPTDACASKGITICQNEEEMIKAYDYALEFSENKQIIVEEYIKGLELAPAFFIVDGKVEFTSCDVILYGDRDNGNNMCVTIFPTKLQDLFLEQCKDKVQLLCDRLGSKFGNFYFEVLYANDKFYFIELIHRVDGVGIWSLTQKMQGFNVIKRMVNYSLGYKEPEREKPMGNANVGGIYFYWANPGIISKIVGREEVSNMEGVEFILDRFREGDEIKESGSMLQMAFYVSIVARDRVEFIEKLRKITSVLKIYDVNGKELTEPTLPEKAIMEM